MMNMKSVNSTALFSIGLLFALTGCEKQTPEKAPAVPEPSKPASSDSASTTASAETAKETESAKAPAATNTAAPTATASDAKGGSFAHAGVQFSVPAGWVEEAVTPSPMGPKAVFNLPTEAGKPACSVRITHYPNMRGRPGMDDMNINRWLAQVKKSDGSAITREDANVQEIDLGDVKLIVVDATGVIAGGMGVETSLAERRMISAIVKHANGPHFVKVTGAADAMGKAADSIMTFLKSAKKSS
ncbi:MAG: hypothetical protein ACPGXK_04700 [Phycisphaerae bacterium]